MYTVSSPSDVRRKVTLFDKEMKENIKENIISLLKKQNNEIVPKQDSFMYFPAIYSDANKCVISSLEKISIDKTGNSIILHTSGVFRPKRMSINSLSINEMTQVWKIAIEGAKKRK